MRRISLALISAVSALAFTQIASAADLPRGAPVYMPPPVPVFTWTGCYIGGNLGVAWSRQTGNFAPALLSFNQAPGSIDQDTESLIGGVHVGCNYQFASQFVVGAEGDWSWTSLDASGSAPNRFANGLPVGSGGITMSSDTKWLASLRGRLGWVIVPQAMIYATAGAAWAKTDYAGLDAYLGGCPNCGAVSFSSTKSGWVAGGGVEYMLTPTWLLRGEYLYYQLSGDGATGLFSGTTTPAAVFNWDDLKVHEFRVGLSYKFW